jgi:hypothetical protein
MRRDTSYATLFLYFRKARKADVQVQDKAAVGGAETCQTQDVIGCGLPGFTLQVPWRSCPIDGTTGGTMLPRIDTNQSPKGKRRSRRETCERR